MAALVLYGCNGGGGDSDEGPISADCSQSRMRPERQTRIGLQGQVPAAMGPAGFRGSAATAIDGQYKGEGASWQHAWFRTRRPQMQYYDTSISTTNRSHAGTVTLDVSDASNPTPTAYLTTQSMLDPLGESLKVNEKRQMLGARYAVNGTGTGQLDLYDYLERLPQPAIDLERADGFGAERRCCRAARMDRRSRDTKGISRRTD
jgi:hypothetical protein